MAIKIIENKSPHYGPRTFVNAKSAGVTAAIAIDFHTAGEKLTHKAAGNAYLSFSMEIEKIEVPVGKHAQRLVSFMKRGNITTINVAGNGIYTMTRFGWDQARVNQYVHDLLNEVKKEIGITHIYSGGQTGADIAGAVAAYKLGIDVTMNMPRGLKQRYEDGKDINRIPKDVYMDIVKMAKALPGESHKFSNATDVNNFLQSAPARRPV